MQTCDAKVWKGREDRRVDDAALTEPSSCAISTELVLS